MNVSATCQSHKCPQCGYAWRTVGPEDAAVHLSTCLRCNPSDEMKRSAVVMAEALVNLLNLVGERVQAGKLQPDAGVLVTVRQAHDALNRAGVKP